MIISQQSQNKHSTDPSHAQFFHQNCLCWSIWDAHFIRKLTDGYLPVAIHQLLQLWNCSRNHRSWGPLTAGLIFKQFLPTSEATVPVTDSHLIESIISINNSLQGMYHICSTLPNLAHELDVGTVPKLSHCAGQLAHIFTEVVPVYDRHVPTFSHYPHICTKATANTSYTIAATPQSIQLCGCHSSYSDTTAHQQWTYMHSTVTAWILVSIRIHQKMTAYSISLKHKVVMSAGVLIWQGMSSNKCMFSFCLVKTCNWNSLHSRPYH